MMSIHVKQSNKDCKHYFRMKLATVANAQPAAIVSSTGKPSLASDAAIKARQSAISARPPDMVSRFIVSRLRKAVRDYRDNPIR